MTPALYGMCMRRSVVSGLLFPSETCHAEPPRQNGKMGVARNTDDFTKLSHRLTALLRHGNVGGKAVDAMEFADGGCRGGVTYRHFRSAV
jgi:hypothetical protein